MFFEDSFAMEQSASHARARARWRDGYGGKTPNPIWFAGRLQVLIEDSITSAGLALIYTSCDRAARAAVRAPRKGAIRRHMELAEIRRQRSLWRPGRAARERANRSFSSEV
jgi:hypothetical protein